MKKTKYEYIPIGMVRIMEQELRKLQQQQKNKQPTRIEAWKMVEDKMVRGLFKKNGR